MSIKMVIDLGKWEVCGKYGIEEESMYMYMKMNELYIIYIYLLFHISPFPTHHVCVRIFTPMPHCAQGGIGNWGNVGIMALNGLFRRNVI